MSNQQLLEFAWGLTGNGQDFLWVIHSDLVRGDSAVLPDKFLQDTSTAWGLLTSWCPQEAVLTHPAIGGFFSHCGWNSTLESICGCWGIDMGIDSNVRREEVGALIGDLMAGTKGEEMRKKALSWKESAENAAKPGGSSAMNLDKLVESVLLSPRCCMWCCAAASNGRDQGRRDEEEGAVLEGKRGECRQAGKLFRHEPG
ncbi:hypothetical protein Taro_016609 [Colocasia esculenta]|uniref:Uncharacterized protein n=1 Tax=Colocasia esculenta TaxID=4460 RepID=A0A843UQQ3_COLES|nr:hypothetical protein [Colocasia esculenta]